MDEGQIIARALEIARTRFPDSPYLHAPFVASVLYLTSGGWHWRIPDLGHDGTTVWEQVVFRQFPPDRLPEGGVTLDKAVKMITESGAFTQLSTRHWHCQLYG